MSYQIRPIGPHDVKKPIPEFVIEAVNELINEKHNDAGGEFIIRQGEIKERIMSKTSQDFDFAWLDFEATYRAAGWRVEYDEPHYSDNYEAFFRFSARRER